MTLQEKLRYSLQDKYRAILKYDMIDVIADKEEYGHDDINRQARNRSSDYSSRDGRGDNNS
ncbi:hypothetical protein GCM10007063_01330 [Lentibacillus kapialis]|uniref:Uncharacterized protein n=1 Tax=Lentibacillus kapialis TaxID=340214 RepID=A0A917PK56_9BACI|nr:hypothetical protein GCM10007063_01330 [Lentibacillus kapialis]